MRRVGHTLSAPGVLLVAVGVVAGIGLLDRYIPVPPRAPIIGHAVITTLVSAPIAWWLPTARVGSLGRLWHTPPTAFLLSRPLIYQTCNGVAGKVVGFGILGIWRDYYYLIDALTTLPSAVVFIVSASRRFRRPADGEISMSFWSLH